MKLKSIAVVLALLAVVADVHHDDLRAWLTTEPVVATGHQVPQYAYDAIKLRHGRRGVPEMLAREVMSGGITLSNPGGSTSAPSWTGNPSTAGFYYAQTGSVGFDNYGLLMCGPNYYARIGAECNGGGTTPSNSLNFYAVAGSIQWYVDGTTGALTSNGAKNLIVGGDIRATTNAGIYLDTSGTKRLYWDGTNITSNAPVSVSSIVSPGAMTIVPNGSTLAIGGSNFDVNANGTLTTTGPATIRASASSSASGPVQSTLNVNTTGVGNLAASGPDDLQTYTLPANSLITTGRCLKIIAYGTQANNTNAKTVRLTIGPTPTVLITKQLQQTAVGAGDTWKIEAIVCRTGASTQDFVAEATNYGGTTVSVVDGPTVVSEDAVGTLTQTETNALVIKTQSTVSTTDNDITSELLMVEAL